MSRVGMLTVTMAALFVHPWLRAQSPSSPSVEFDVVSIKPNTAGPGSPAGLRTMADGTFTMTNQPIRSVIMNASPTPAREVVGIPNWVNTDRYDITAKPPAGTPRDQVPLMWQALFADRMKLVAHVEEQERSTFALVLDRSDGRLGPQLKPSTLDCGPRPPGSAPPPPPAAPPSPADVQKRCGMMMGQGTIVSGGMRMDALVLSLGGIAGGLVNNRTGLEGFYAFTLNYSRAGGLGPAAGASDPGDAPNIFTAIREQLGLKLQPEKTKVPILVVDHIERPTEN